MTQDITTTGPSRRSIAKGAAWAVPAVSVAAAAPSLAASPTCSDADGWQPGVRLDQGCLVAVAGLGVSAGWQICAGADCAIPAGTQFTERVVAYHDEQIGVGPITRRNAARTAVLAHVTWLTASGVAGPLFENFNRSRFSARTEETIGGRLATVRTRTFTTKNAIAAGQCSGYGYLLTLSIFDAIHHDVAFEPTGLRTVLDPGLLNQCN